MSAAPDGIRLHRLPRAAPLRVLACGAWLKNTAALLDGHALHLSPLHGDLGTPQAVRALHESARALLRRVGNRVDAIAHDLHPDFASTRLAQALAAELGVPALPVQHHHAHIAAVQAESGDTGPCIGLALDGTGLGSDGLAWGGELLAVAGARWQRLGHLTPLALPGGDRAAREPWRMAAAALHALGRGGEIVPRLAPAVGPALAQGVAAMLQRGLHCPATTSAGRWFDAVAGLLGLCVRQAAEAQAAQALERAALAHAVAAGAAAGWPGPGGAGWPPTARPAGPADPDRPAGPARLACLAPPPGAGRVQAAPPGADRVRAELDLRSLLGRVLALHDAGRGPAAALAPATALAAPAAPAAQAAQAAQADPAGSVAPLAPATAAAAAAFHAGLAQCLADAAAAAAPLQGTRRVVLGGGCFHNRVLRAELHARLRAAGLEVAAPALAGPGDAGIAAGQAWAAAWTLAAARAARAPQSSWVGVAGAAEPVGVAHGP